MIGGTAKCHKNGPVCVRRAPGDGELPRKLRAILIVQFAFAERVSESWEPHWLFCTVWVLTATSQCRSYHPCYTETLDHTVGEQSVWIWTSVCLTFRHTMSSVYMCECACTHMHTHTCLMCSHTHTLSTVYRGNYFLKSSIILPGYFIVCEREWIFLGVLFCFVLFNEKSG